MVEISQDIQTCHGEALQKTNQKDGTTTYSIHRDSNGYTWILSWIKHEKACRSCRIPLEKTSKHIVKHTGDFTWIHQNLGT
jgi:hypothetical protein